MSEMPEEVVQIITQSALEHPNDVDSAVMEAEASLRSLDSFPQLVNLLVRKAVRELVHQTRANSNKTVKKQSGYWQAQGNTRVVEVGSSTVVDVYGSVFDTYFLGGMCLGDLTGFMLDKLIIKSQEIAEGHVFNARLCSWLKSKGVQGDVRVRDVVNESDLRTNFRRLMQEKYARRNGRGVA